LKKKKKTFFPPFFLKKENLKKMKKIQVGNFLLFFWGLFLAARFTFAIPLATTKIPVRHHSYVNLLIGNPGKYTLLKIDYTLNETLVLFNEPLQTSRTFSLYPPSVIVYVGEHVVRLPVTFEHFRFIKYPFLRHDCEGILGVGTYSQLWSYWHKASISSAMLVLGEHDYSLTRRPYSNYEMVFDNSHPIYILLDEDDEDSRNITVKLNLRDRHTMVPNEIFYNPTKHRLKFKGKYRIPISHEDLEYLTEDHVSFSLVYKNNNDSLVIGTEFLVNFVVMFDIVTQVYKLYPPFTAFENGNSEPAYTYTLLLTLAPLFVYYHISVNIGNPISARKYFFIETAAYFIGLVAMAIEWVGFRADRVFIFRLDAASDFYFIFFCVVVAVTALLGTLLSFRFAKKRKHLNLRKIFLETVVIGAIWLNQVRFTAEDQNNATAVFLALVLTINRMIQFMFILFYGIEKTLLLFVCFLYTVLSVLFLFFYNFNSILNYNFYGFGGHLDSMLLLFELFALLPSVTIFLQADVAILLDR
jgi:hypothetical protein